VANPSLFLKKGFTKAFEYVIMKRLQEAGKEVQMIKIAIVEDNKIASDTLLEYLNIYSEKSGETFESIVFRDAISFLTGYKSVYDIVFMDIELPHLDGMAAAAKLRQVDKKILLIFVTNMAQFAVKGYEVDALDYIVKPVGYSNFELKLKKAVALVKSNTDAITINKAGGLIRLPAREVKFIEASGHKIIYHTDADEVQGGGESLSELEVKLRPYGFLRCNNCYLVNVRQIESVQGYVITMYGGEEVQISRPRKKNFMTELADWLGKGN